ncbi:hypothetical protein OF83DRAFT_167549 [Amylostereum chailletii]|nr:hypothetical protein OF83DRAFT_167549 [Amylostereum chailletii]
MILDDALGGILLGTFLSVMLYGICTLQAVLYFTDKLDEPMFLKALVSVVWVLETVHTAFTIYNIYVMTVTNFGDLESPGLIFWSEPAYILTGIVIMFAVHCFFTRRVWLVCGKPLIFTGILVVMVIAHFVIGLVIGVAYKFRTWPEFRKHDISLIVVCGGLGSAAVADILIAAALSLYLRRGRQDLHERFSGVLNQIIFFIVSTGTLTALTSVGTVIAFATDKYGGVFLGMATLQSKVYANSLLANLNSRKKLRNKLTSSGSQVEFTTVQPLSMDSHRYPPNGSNISRRAETAQSGSSDTDVTSTKQEVFV